MVFAQPRSVWSLLVGQLGSVLEQPSVSSRARDPTAKMTANLLDICERMRTPMECASQESNRDGR